MFRLFLRLNLVVLLINNLKNGFCEKRKTETGLNLSLIHI